MVQTALTPAGSSPGDDWAGGTVLPPDDTFAMAVGKLANYIISERVVDVVDRNSRPLSVRQRALSDLLESFGVLADHVEENHVFRCLRKTEFILARISCIFKVVSVVSSDPLKGAFDFALVGLDLPDITAALIQKREN